MLVQYNNGLETICKKNHKSMSILWDFLESQLVWKLLLRIFANYFPPLIFTWGMVVWTSLVHSLFHHYVESLDHAFLTCFGMILCISFSDRTIFRKN